MKLIIARPVSGVRPSSVTDNLSGKGGIISFAVNMTELPDEFLFILDVESKK